MKQIASLILSLFSIIAFSQNDEEIKTSGLFYKISLAATLTINEEYTLTKDDDTGPFLIPNAYL